jgi:hypothetical protein
MQSAACGTTRYLINGKKREKKKVRNGWKGDDLTD